MDETMATERDPRFDVFLSHNSLDKPMVEDIAARLQRAGLEPWLDKWYLTPGGRWQDELEAGLTASAACAVFVGPHGLGDWVHEEVGLAVDRAAKDRSFRLFLVLLPGVPEPFDASGIPGFLRTRTWVDLRPGVDDARAFGQLIAAVRGSAQSPTSPRPPSETVIGDHGPGAPASEPAPRHRLPVPPTPLIGREREREIARRQLLGPEVRLLTMSGPAGIGKTRLALQVAADVQSDFAAGVVFVPLAAITDPALVATTIAQAVGARVTSNEPAAASLTDDLRDKHALLVLDNFEQVLPAAPLVADLLAACPRLKVLVTSRSVLHLRGERNFPVPPLRLPDLEHLPSIEQLTHYEAVRLFIERAVDVRSDFAVDNENAPAVAAICWRLDGLPLAIELAAKRVKVFPPEILLGRLERRLKVLTGGARDLPTRQQTLRGAIAWSYDLLEVEEQVLFRRLAVFVGGCTLEAVEAVVGDSLDLDLVDALASLVDKSLVWETEEQAGTSYPEPRFSMLETIREYAWEQLVASAEAEPVRERHATHYLALVESTRKVWDGPRHLTLRTRLRREQANLRAALLWSEEHPDAEIGPRVAAALAWVASILVEAFQGKAAASNYERLLGMARQRGNKALELEALLGLADAYYVLALDDQDPATIARSREHNEAALVLARELGNTPAIVRSLARSR
jgi:predicted ATPase